MKNHHLHDIRGERKDQLLITVDKGGNRIGEATREVCHQGEGKTHLAFMALVRDSSNRFILTRRSSKKSLWSGYWDASVVSHVLANETIEQAAQRRGKEELGIVVNFRDLGAFYYFARHGQSCENEYCHVLIGETKEDIYPNPIEIEEFEMLDTKKLKSEILMNKNRYTPWLKLALEKIDLPEV